MQDKFLYLAVDFGCIIFPLLFSFYTKFNFYKQWRYFVWPCLTVAAFFIIWDAVFTHIGVWSFNNRYVLGYYFMGLPLEEFLFFICIPYACTFTYHCMQLFFNFERFRNAASKVSLVLASVLVLIALLHLSQLYTSVTFVLLAAFLVFIALKKATYMPAFYLTFLLILIPFFISNGILTGTGLPEPVVIYNNKHNLGIRMFTIPFEDTFYGMLLLLLNVAGYEWMRRRVNESGQMPRRDDIIVEIRAIKMSQP